MLDRWATVWEGCSGGVRFGDGEEVDGCRWRRGTHTECESGEAWVEVDGERLVYQASGSLYYLCDINAEQIFVNFQIEPGDTRLPA